MRDLKQQKDEVMEMLKIVKESAKDGGHNKTLLEDISFDSFIFVMDKVESLVDWLWFFR